MASGNDYSLDPFQTEEDTLNELYKRALVKTLRPLPPMEDLAGRFDQSMEVAQGNREISQVTAKRQALGEKFQASLVNALRDQPEEIKALVLNPATRVQGLDLMKQRQQMVLDQQEMDSMRKSRMAQNADATSPLPASSAMQDYQDALYMAQSSNPRIAARGKLLLDQMKFHDPKEMARGNLQGGVDVPQGAEEAYRRQQDIAGDQQVITLQTGQGPWTGTRGEARRLGLIQGTSPGMPASSPAPGSSAGPVASPPSMPASGSNMPVSGGPTGAGGAGGDPRAAILQEQIQLLQVALQNGDQKAAAIHARNIQQLQQGMQAGLQNTNPQAFAQSAGAVPGMPQGIPQPNAGMGRSNPTAQDVFKAQAETNQKAGAKLDEVSPMGSLLFHIDRLEEVNRKPTWSGGAAAIPQTVANIASTFTGDAGQRTDNTMEFESIVQNIIGPMLHQYGYNPSNRDLIQAEKRLPSVGNSVRARQQIIDQVRRGVIAEIEVNNQAKRAVEQAAQEGRTLDLKTAQDYFWQLRNSQEGTANPTQGAGKTPLLPASVAQLNAALQKEGGGNLMEDIAGKFASLPNALLTQGSAAKDAYGNIIEGAKQLVGQGDREAWKIEEERQRRKAMENPDYEQAKIFHETFNPTAFIGGTTTSVPKILGAAILQGAMRPRESWADQAAEGVKSAMVAAPFAALSKAVPSTELSKEVNLGGRGEALHREFPSVKITSSQMNPSPLESGAARILGANEAASLEQGKAITKELMSKAGIKGEELTTKVIADAKSAMGDEYNKLFPKTMSPRIDSQDSQALQNAITNVASVQDLMAKAPTLAKIHSALQNTSNPIKLTAEELHKAWKEVGKVAGNDPQAAGEVRGVLEGLITKVIFKKDIQVFKDLNRRWGLTEDIERIYRSGAGEGTAELSGYLRPSEIVKNAGTGSAADKAAQFINKFDIQDFSHDQAGSLGLGRVIGEGGKGVGKVINAMDISGLDWSNPVKALVEALRIGLIRGPQNVYQGRTE